MKHTIIGIQESILKAINNKDTSCCLLFAKAFDTVNHQSHLNKFNHYSIQGSTLQLIESYLTRSECIQIKDTFL